ncbi:hypothetical protein EVAR_63636_1 [Eumeta japonica]|uniref:Uncharacterized protein n=1 Tax=Eumeta variegata TaxID=151549 RepID=A0A4C1ZZQ8_EUMVA|nr:hypothetical protein EVAR_63636_1 [Eumeta japonica]
MAARPPALRPTSLCVPTAAPLNHPGSIRPIDQKRSSRLNRFTPDMLRSKRAKVLTVGQKTPKAFGVHRTAKLHTMWTDFKRPDCRAASLNLRSATTSRF